MTSYRPTLDEQPVQVRHYPLNLYLPFERYEHRPLAARDILVHRIMSKLLFPASRGLSQVYETHRSKENGLHNFGTIREHDRVLARDLELLRKMLVTCSVTDVLYDGFAQPPGRLALQSLLYVGAHGTHRRLPPNPTLLGMPVPEDTYVHVTIGEEILDLARRHYFETDDPSTRLWLQATQPPVSSSYNTLPSLPKPKETRTAWAQQRRDYDRTNRRLDEKKWYPEDTEHLKRLQVHTKASRSLELYDGGTLLPHLRQPLLQARSSRMRYHSMQAQQGEDVILSPEGGWGVIKDTIYPWPGADSPRRFLHCPTWRSRHQKYHWFMAMENMPPVDFASGRTGRGMNRDGIWSTGRWIYEGEVRGRPGRRGRRRACSEPPPDMFTSSRLPWNFHHPRELLILPKMSLATVDRRSRRRSLSRTRIAEMFDWDTVLTAQPTKANPEVEGQTLPEGQPTTTPSPMYDKPCCVHEIEQRIENLRESRTGDFLWGGDIDLYDDILVTLQGNTFPLLSCCRNTEPGSCANCTSTGHATSHCRNPCGFCGAPSPKTLYPAVISRRVLTTFGADDPGEHGNLHIASECPVARHNRCKCGPFPQYHTAEKCPVVCSRKCGNDHPPGHFKHKNAMTCRARCCMCGMKGHSGQQCKLKKCRCGGTHLGQDCRWKVECRVRDCDNFLCGLHCDGCGVSRRELEEGLGFSGGMCPSCLSDTGSDTTDNVKVDDGDNDGQQGNTPYGYVDAHTQKPFAKKGRRKPIRKRRDAEGKKKVKEELPWYAPLQPRTRPIVTSKSGKKATWRN